MSVLIKGMKMPDECGHCRFANAFDCAVTGSFISTHSIRQPDCPLVDVPPHGRLIDEEAVIDHFVSLSNNEWNQNVSTSWANAFAEAASDICDIPTIIESEEET